MDRHNHALVILQEGTVIPAIPLALDENRKFDIISQRRIVQYYLRAGAGGIAAAVHSTQFEIRDPKHNLLHPVLETVAEEIDAFEKETGKTIVRVAGVCGAASQACSEATLAKELGYDAVLLSPGGLGHLSEEDLLERTKAVAQVLPVIGFYLQEAVGGRKLSRQYWKALSDIPGVAAIKCACFDRYRTQDLVKGVMESQRADEVALYTGNDDHIVMDLVTPFVHDGKKKYFVGGLLGQWSVWTNRAVEIFNRCKETQKTGIIPADLLTIGEHLTEANGAVFDVANRFAGCIPGLHYILQKQGLMETVYCLNPDETLSEGQAAEIDRLWAAYPDVADDAFMEAFIKQFCP